MIKRDCYKLLKLYQAGYITRKQAMRWLEIFHNWADLEVNESANECFLDEKI